MKFSRFLTFVFVSALFISVNNSYAKTNILPKHTDISVSEQVDEIEKELSNIDSIYFKKYQDELPSFMGLKNGKYIDSEAIAVVNNSFIVYDHAKHCKVTVEAIYTEYGKFIIKNDYIGILRVNKFYPLQKISSSKVNFLNGYIMHKKMYDYGF